MRGRFGPVLRVVGLAVAVGGLRMIVHLGVQRPLGENLLQLGQQAILSNAGFASAPASN